jgi:hypothetical protein
VLAAGASTPTASGVEQKPRINQAATLRANCRTSEARRRAQTGQPPGRARHHLSRLHDHAIIVAGDAVQKAGSLDTRINRSVILKAYGRALRALTNQDGWSRPVSS